MSHVRSPVFIGLLLVLFLGIAVYFRLWAIDSAFSEEETEIIRKQFDLANKEAMEESAEWRLKYDETRHALEQKTEEAARMHKSLTKLQKENINLLDRVESITQELENEKLKCNTRQSQVR